VPDKRKLPGDISHLGRYDPLERDLSWVVGPGHLGSPAPGEVEGNMGRYNESMRRQFRQSELAGTDPLSEEQRRVLAILLQRAAQKDLGDFNPP